MTSYGMSESSGRCVHDGRPLPCTEVAFDEEGRIHLGGATIAHGYLGRPDLTAVAFGTDEDGIRWFCNDDVGRTDEHARLRVDGRVDDMINTGGFKVAPRLVEDAIIEHVPGVREVVVVGTRHTEWGEAVSALVVLEPGTAPRPPRAHGRRPAGAPAWHPPLLDHALPVRAATAEEVPLAGPGKPDRRAVVAILTVG